MNQDRRPGSQIPLPLALKEKPGLDQFIVGENQEAIHTLRNTARGIAHSNLFIWGQHGCGISHLLQAACLLADSAGRKLSYVPLASIPDIEPQILENLEQLDLVFIDDIDRATDLPDWEQALFNLYNRTRESGSLLVIGSHTRPQALPFSLQDLKSRMSWDLVYRISPLGDADKIEALQRRARSRGFQLPSEVAGFIVNRVNRDMPSLMNCLDVLENESLVEQRKLTIPFVRRLLGLG